MPYRPRRTAVATAFAVTAPVLAGLGFAAAALATAPAVSAHLPTEPSAAETTDAAPVPTQLIAAGPGSFSPEQRAGSDRTVPRDLVEDRLTEWVALPDGPDDAFCTGTLSTERPGQFSTCSVTDASGQKQTYYGYVAESLAYGSDFQLFYAEGAPLSDEATAVLTDEAAAVIVYPVYDETSAVKPRALTSQQAVAAGNRILELAGQRDLRIVSVMDRVDLTSPEPVEAVAEDRATGAVRTVHLLPVVMEGESPVLVVSVEAV